MKNGVKLLLSILGISLLVLWLEAFIFKFSGAFGLLICLVTIYLIVGTIIRLLKLSEIFETDFFDKIDILFFLK